MFPRPTRHAAAITALLTAAAFLGACSSRQVISGTHTLRVETTTPAAIDLDGVRLGSNAVEVPLRYRLVRKKKVSPWLVGLGVTGLVLTPLSFVSGALYQDFSDTFLVPADERTHGAEYTITGVIVGLVFLVLGGVALAHSVKTTERIEVLRHSIGVAPLDDKVRFSLEIDGKGLDPKELVHLRRLVYDDTNYRWSLEYAPEGMKLTRIWRNSLHIFRLSKPASKPPTPTKRPAAKRKDTLSEIMSFR